MHPRLVGELTGDFLRNPRAVAIQFRYAFVTDDDGLKVLDITDPDAADSGASGVVRLKHPGVSMSHALMPTSANGPEGLAIIDVANRVPRLDQMFSADGALTTRAPCRSAASTLRCLRWSPTAKTDCA